MFTVADVVSFLTKKTNGEMIIDQEDDTPIEHNGGTVDVGGRSSSSSAPPLSPSPSSAVKPPPFSSLFDTYTPLKVPVNSDRAQSNTPVKPDRAQSTMRPPLFPLFDTDTDDDNDDNGDDVDGIIKSLEAKATKQISGTTSGPNNSGTVAYNNSRLFIQGALGRMRQVRLSDSNLP